MTPELLKSEADNCDAQSGLSPAPLLGHVNEQRRKAGLKGYLSGLKKGTVHKFTEAERLTGAKLGYKKAGKKMLQKAVDANIKYWSLIRGRTEFYRFKNLSKFVFDNPQLFDPKDMRVNPRKPRVCNAIYGLALLSPRKKRRLERWKEWRWNHVGSLVKSLETEKPKWPNIRS